MSFPAILKVSFHQLSAFTQARYKLRWRFFEDWSAELVKNSSALYTKKRKGCQVFRIDGPTLYLPNNKGVINEFGLYTSPSTNVPTARVMCMCSWLLSSE